MQHTIDSYVKDKKLEAEMQFSKPKVIDQQALREAAGWWGCIGKYEGESEAILN